MGAELRFKGGISETIGQLDKFDVSVGESEAIGEITAKLVESLPLWAKSLRKGATEIVEKKAIGFCDSVATHIISKGRDPSTIAVLGQVRRLLKVIEIPLKATIFQRVEEVYTEWVDSDKMINLIAAAQSKIQVNEDVATLKSSLEAVMAKLKDFLEMLKGGQRCSQLTLRNIS
jgi:hypothetical protein